MNSLEELPNEPILYELLEYNVWKQDPELIRCKNDTVVLPNTGTIKNALRYLNNRYSLPENVSRQVTLTLPWKFTVGDSGRLLAILQENVIEIRKAKDEYSSILGKVSVPKDAFPQWRKIMWSPDGTILVLASSNGYTSFYSSLGNNIFNISPSIISQNSDVLEAGDAIASMIFLKPRRTDDKWSYEFILISYSGLLRSYYISTTNGYVANYEYSFENYYKNGINAVAYDEKSDLFYIAGNALTHKSTTAAAESGLTSWRLLNEYPYCKLSFTFDEGSSTKGKFSLWNIIPVFKTQAESIIFKIKISPCSKLLASLHTDGTISLWLLPSLSLCRRWSLVEQPDFNVPNPLAVTRYKRSPLGVTEFYPIDVAWWSDQALIIARHSGSISVCSIKDLKNLLGASPEFFTGPPQISEVAPGRGFLCLDCETVVTSKKRNRESPGEEASSESEKEDGEIEPVTILNYATNLLQNAVYSITDIERFQPKRKKSRVLHRTYKILGLRSTTPEELYSRKIDLEEYEEALALAQTYNLDTDLVYQTQWRKSTLSLSAIREHLSKVSKRSWVLNECVTRVPDSIDAARELLKFGLRCANLETLLAIGETDNGKFASEDDDNLEVDEATVELKQVQKVNNILEKIDVTKLSDAQKELIRYRRQLLDHLDKLLTYEIILEPTKNYSKDFYEKFRQLTILQNAIRFAKDSNYIAVEIMFTYHGKTLLPHWLAIINFFPETLSPLRYKKLLPECDAEGQLYLLYQCELRRKDWSEKPEFDNIVAAEDTSQSQFMYEEEPSLHLYENTELNPNLLSQWYKSRAYQIERNSFMTENALELVRIAKANNINGLGDLLVNLETLDDLVYKLYMEQMSLDQLEKLTNLEKMKLLMSTSHGGNFVNNIKTLAIPFIKRIEKYMGGDLKKSLLHDYLVYQSKDELNLTAQFFECLKQIRDIEIISMLDDIHTLALDCIYACEEVDMCQKAERILESLPKDFNDNNRNGMSHLIEELGKELECVQIFNTYDLKMTLNFIKNSKTDPEAIKLLLTQMARNLSKSVVPRDENDWAELLDKMLRIHGLIFTCVDVEVCFEICVSARLMSGNKDSIQACAALIETRKNEQSLLKVSYEKAVNLILDACKEYFNSSRSLTDTNMELAKACLHLITDNNAQIKAEFDLINALQILNEFEIDMLPLQIRLMQDRLKLISDCLSKRADAYKNKQRLLTLATYLKIEENSRIREGKVLELIAKKALEIKDHSVCGATCLQLMQINYIPSWPTILSLGCCKEFEDLQVRTKCLWFAINNGPIETLSDTLKEVRLIEVQKLNKDLQMWMPPVQESISFEDESEDEFTDAMTTPQVENKEFVPKMLETSTEIMKNSANIMRQSTFSLIKNLGNTGFWKSRLQLMKNFTSTAENDVQHESDNEHCEDNAGLQSFPCFYMSLHKNCRVSPLYTRYTKYSTPEVENRKLKYCQVWLRIAMLGLTSDYSIEDGDINRLLLECAKYTLSEDWMLGMSYLLNVNKRLTPGIEALFADLPHTDLYIQSIMYFYSLELHKKLYKNVDDLYLYDPSSLIHRMLNVTKPYGECDIQKQLLHWQSYLYNNHNENNISEETKDEVLDENKEEIVTNEDHVAPIGSNVQNMIDRTDTDHLKVEDQSISNLEDNIEWTDDWGDFVDDDDIKTSFDSDILKQGSTNENSNTKLAEDVSSCSTEKARFTLFIDKFDKMHNEEDYLKVKNMLLQWPEFTAPEFNGADTHPILKLMSAAAQYLKENSVFQEYKKLTCRLPSTDILKAFLTKDTGISLEYSLYIRLCTEDSSLHKEAIDIIIENYPQITFSPAILQELFLKDLTVNFNPDHEVYNRIIKHVYRDQALADVNIEENTKILIQELLKRKHVMHAMSIINLIGEIPPSMRTFSSCLQLLMHHK